MSPTCVLLVDTTDVQKANVVATAIDLDEERLKIECHFITGSKARGCMVMVSLSNGSRRDNHIMTFNLTRDGNRTSYLDTNATSHPMHYIYCYDMAVVSAYDIEEDGSIGTVAVPGAFIYNAHTDHCSSQNSQSEFIKVFKYYHFNHTFYILSAGDSD